MSCEPKRTCTICGQEKPFALFHKQPNGLHGLSSWCKPCKVERAKAAQRADPAKAKAQRHAIYLRRRGKHLADVKARRAADPKKARNYRRAHYLKNRERVRLVSKAYSEANKERLNQKTKEWAARNPLRRRAAKIRRRAAERSTGGGFTAEQIEALYRVQRGRCACCSDPLTDGYHCDHIIALCKGGANDIRNIQLLCPPCNLSKGSKDPIDFMQSRGFLL